METIREMALRTYNEAINRGVINDTPINWYIWKMAFDEAEKELKTLINK